VLFDKRITLYIIFYNIINLQLFSSFRGIALSIICIFNEDSYFRNQREALFYINNFLKILKYLYIIIQVSTYINIVLTRYLYYHIKYLPIDY